MGESDKFVLRWNDFEKNIVGAHKNLRADRDLTDCTLVCAGQTFQTHRVVLAACSPVLREMILSVTAAAGRTSHPALYLSGVQRSHLAALLDFMYNGETALPEQELETFLATAEELQVRGLTLGTGGEPPEESGGSVMGNSRRVSEANLASAVDEDVNSLLAGLDTEPPATKRVKQERRPAQTAGAAAQVKQEARERLANLPMTVSLARVEQPALAPVPVPAPASLPAPAPATPARSTFQPAPASSPVRPQATPAADQQEARARLAALSGSVSLGGVAVSSAPPLPPTSLPTLLPVSFASLASPLRPSPVRPQAVSGAAPLQPLQAAAASPRLQVADSRLQAFYSDPRLQAMGAGASPPVLHLPEGYNGGALPGAAGAGDGTGQGEDLEYTRQIENFIEKVQASGQLRCRACGKTNSAKSKASLINHIESCHMEAALACSVCNKTFKARSYLKQHQKRGGCGP